MEKKEKKVSRKSPSKEELNKEKDIIAGRIYRLRILQGRLANAETLGRYAKEEEELTKKLAKLED